MDTTMRSSGNGSISYEDRTIQHPFVCSRTSYQQQQQRRRRRWMIIHNNNILEARNGGRGLALSISVVIGTVSSFALYYSMLSIVLLLLVLHPNGTTTTIVMNRLGDRGSTFVVQALMAPPRHFRSLFSSTSSSKSFLLQRYHRSISSSTALEAASSISSTSSSLLLFGPKQRQKNNDIFFWATTQTKSIPQRPQRTTKSTSNNNKVKIDVRPQSMTQISLAQGSIFDSIRMMNNPSKQQQQQPPYVSTTAARNARKVLSRSAAATTATMMDEELSNYNRNIGFGVFLQWYNSVFPNNGPIEYVPSSLSVSKSQVSYTNWNPFLFRTITSAQRQQQQQQKQPVITTDEKTSKNVWNSFLSTVSLTKTDASEQTIVSEEQLLSSSSPITNWFETFVRAQRDVVEQKKQKDQEYAKSLIETLGEEQYKYYNKIRPLASEGSWHAYLTYGTNGEPRKAFYFNQKTGQTQWNPPSSTFPYVGIVRDPVETNSFLGRLLQGGKSVQLASQGVWTSYLDKATYRVYYYNQETGVSQWEKPTKDFPLLNINTVDVVAKPIPIVTGNDSWSAYIAGTASDTKQSRGSAARVYYYNGKTGLSQWEKPYASFPVITLHENGNAVLSEPPPIYLQPLHEFYHHTKELIRFPDLMQLLHKNDQQQQAHDDHIESNILYPQKKQVQVIIQEENVDTNKKTGTWFGPMLLYLQEKWDKAEQTIQEESQASSVDTVPEVATEFRATNWIDTILLPSMVISSNKKPASGSNEMIQKKAMTKVEQSDWTKSIFPRFNIEPTPVQETNSKGKSKTNDWFAAWIKNSKNEKKVNEVSSTSNRNNEIFELRSIRSYLSFMDRITGSSDSESIQMDTKEEKEKGSMWTIPDIVMSLQKTLSEVKFDTPDVLDVAKKTVSNVADVMKAIPATLQTVDDEIVKPIVGAVQKLMEESQSQKATPSTTTTTSFATKETTTNQGMIKDDELRLAVLMSARKASAFIVRTASDVASPQNVRKVMDGISTVQSVVSDLDIFKTTDPITPDTAATTVRTVTTNPIDVTARPVIFSATVVEDTIPRTIAEGVATPDKSRADVSEEIQSFANQKLVTGASITSSASKTGNAKTSNIIDVQSIKQISTTSADISSEVNKQETITPKSVLKSEARRDGAEKVNTLSDARATSVSSSEVVGPTKLDSFAPTAQISSKTSSEKQKTKVQELVKKSETPPPTLSLRSTATVDNTEKKIQEPTTSSSKGIAPEISTTKAAKPVIAAAFSQLKETSTQTKLSSIATSKVSFTKTATANVRDVARSEKLRRLSDNVRAAIERKVPLLYEWKQNDDGSITGLISNSKEVKTGTKITTSKLQYKAKPGDVILADTGKEYFLFR